MESNEKFGKMLMKRRKEIGCSLRQLSDGLCDYSDIQRIENNEIEADVLLKIRLFERLQIATDHYDKFVYREDYDRLKLRNTIIELLQENKYSKAKLKLEKYRKKYAKLGKIDKQFYLSLCAITDHSPELIEKALELTVPDYKDVIIENKVLSVEELNLYVEYLFNIEKNVNKLYSVKRYIENGYYSNLSKAKIYTKVVYYIYQLLPDNIKAEQKDEIVKACNKGIDVNRSCGNAYYLWELLCVKRELGIEDVDNLIEELEAIYSIYNIPIEQGNYAYIYSQSKIFCIGDVVRTRRKMYGLTIKQLCDGICSERTISRLEKNKTRTQEEIILKVLEQLKISTELMQIGIVSDDEKVIAKYIEYVNKMNAGCYKEAQHLLNELEKKIDESIFTNQYILANEKILLNYLLQEIDVQEYAQKLRELLSMTVDIEKISLENDLYFTFNELIIIKNLMDIGKADLCNKYYRVLWQYIMENSVDIDTKCWIMQSMSMLMEDMGNYKIAEYISHEIIKRCLVNRHLGEIHISTYSIYANEKALLDMDNTMYLDISIAIGRLYGDEPRVKVFLDKKSNMKLVDVG